MSAKEIKVKELANMIAMMEMCKHKHLGEADKGSDVDLEIYKALSKAADELNGILQAVNNDEYEL